MYYIQAEAFWFLVKTEVGIDDDDDDFLETPITTIMCRIIAIYLIQWNDGLAIWRTAWRNALHHFLAQ